MRDDHKQQLFRAVSAVDRPATKPLLALSATAALSLRNRRLSRVWWQDGMWRHDLGGDRAAAPNILFRGPRDWQGDFSSYWVNDSYLPRRGDVVVDVGAGIGTEVLPLSHMVGPEGLVVAVEAFPPVADCLRWMVTANGLTNVDVRDVAVADQPGVVAISSDLDGHEHNSVVGDDHYLQGSRVEVPCTTLDELLSRLPPVAWLKMNIEGAEVAALAGMESQAHRVQNIVVSCHDFIAEAGGPAELRTRDTVEAWLRSHGFSTWRREDDPRPCVRYNVWGTRSATEVRRRLATRPTADPASARSDDDDNGQASVTVVVPLYRNRATIVAALESVASQTRLPESVIVVDDSGDDGSPELVADRFPDVKLIRQPNAGPAAARNTGWRHAATTWVAFLDADDVWEPSKLATQLDAAGRNDDVAVVTCECPVLGAPSPRRSPRRGEVRLSSRDLLLLNRLNSSTMLVRREVLEEVGGLDITLDGIDDWVLALRASERGSIVKVNQPLARWRDRADSYSKDGQRMRSRMRSMMARELPRSGLSSNQQAQVLAWHELRFVVLFVRLHDWRLARDGLAEIRRREVPRAVPAATVRYLLPFLVRQRVRRWYPVEPFRWSGRPLPATSRQERGSISGDARPFQCSCRGRPSQNP